MGVIAGIFKCFPSDGPPWSHPPLCKRILSIRREVGYEASKLTFCHQHVSIATQVPIKSKTGVLMYVNYQLCWNLKSQTKRVCVCVFACVYASVHLCVCVYLCVLTRSDADPGKTECRAGSDSSEASCRQLGRLVLLSIASTTRWIYQRVEVTCLIRCSVRVVTICRAPSQA